MSIGRLIVFVSRLSIDGDWSVAEAIYCGLIQSGYIDSFFELSCLYKVNPRLRVLDGDDLFYRSLNVFVVDDGFGDWVALGPLLIGDRQI
jgi:hypothetical protein